MEIVHRSPGLWKRHFVEKLKNHGDVLTILVIVEVFKWSHCGYGLIAIGQTWDLKPWPSSTSLLQNAQWDTVLPCFTWDSRVLDPTR